MRARTSAAALARSSPGSITTSAFRVHSRSANPVDQVGRHPDVAVMYGGDRQFTFKGGPLAWSFPSAPCLRHLVKERSERRVAAAFLRLVYLAFGTEPRPLDASGQGAARPRPSVRSSQRSTSLTSLTPDGSPGPRARMMSGTHHRTSA